MRDISCYWIIVLIKHQTRPGLHNPKNKSITIPAWWPGQQFLPCRILKHTAVKGGHVTLQKRNWCRDISDILCGSKKGSLFGRKAVWRRRRERGRRRSRRKRAGSVSDASISLWQGGRILSVCLDMLNKLLYLECFFGGVWREKVKQQNRGEWHGSKLCSGFVLMSQLLPGRDWTVPLFFFSRIVAKEPEDHGRMREMLWIYATLFLVSQAWGHETGLNINLWLQSCFTCYINYYFYY